MFLHGLDSSDIRRGDTLANPQFLNNMGNLQTFDIVVANPLLDKKIGNLNYSKVTNMAVLKNMSYHHKRTPTMLLYFIYSNH